MKTDTIGLVRTSQLHNRHERVGQNKLEGEGWTKLLNKDDRVVKD